MFFQGQPQASYDKLTFTKKLDMDSTNKGPAWLDGFKVWDQLQFSINQNRDFEMVLNIPLLFPLQCYDLLPPKTSCQTNSTSFLWIFTLVKPKTITFSQVRHEFPTSLTLYIPLVQHFPSRSFHRYLTMIIHLQEVSVTVAADSYKYTLLQQVYWYPQHGTCII